MLKAFTYYDITNLSNNPKREKFLFEGVEYNTFFPNKDTSKPLLINTFKDGSFNPQKLTTFIYALNNRLGIENHPTPQTTVKTTSLKYDPTATAKNIRDTKVLSAEFLETMQLSNIFKSDYENHENIRFYEDEETAHEVLHFTDGTRHNVRFKWNGEFSYKGWSTFPIESGFESIGAYLKGANNKSATLVLVEGFKDAINANIALPQCDILATDSKNIKFNFSHLKREYKTVILFQDRELNSKEIINLFGELKGEDRKLLNKIYYVNTNALPNNAKDITDFLQSLDMTTKGTKRDALKNIKKVLHLERVKQLENAIEIDEKINPLIENSKH